jgi:hypothetical protein
VIERLSAAFLAKNTAIRRAWIFNSQLPVLSTRWVALKSQESHVTTATASVRSLVGHEAS